MSKVAKAVRGFLKSMDWRWQETTPTRYEVIVPGHTSQWFWLAQWEEDDSFFAGHSIVPVSVPAKRRLAATSFDGPTWERDVPLEQSFGARPGKKSQDFPAARDHGCHTPVGQ
jgi:hypothetical protein